MFKGKNVNLRPMRIEDISLIEKWFLENELVVRFLGTELASLEAVKKFFEDGLKNPYNRRDFIVEEGDKREPIGATSLEKIKWKDRTADIVIILGEKGRRKRMYSHDAFLMLFDHAFNDLNLRRLQMFIVKCNYKMLDTIRETNQYLGRVLGIEPFKHEGIFKEAVFMRDKYHDVYAYGIFKDDFNDVKQEFRKYLNENYTLD